MQSIIVYNGGSAGDLLKALCLEQVLGHSIHRLELNGMVDFDNHYFKDTCEEIYLNHELKESIKYEHVFPIESTHFYLDFYKEITPNLYYIDYHDSCQDLIINTFIGKKLSGSHEDFYSHFIKFITPAMHKYVNSDNLITAMNVTWLKNLSRWRVTPELKPINFADLFNFNCLIEIVTQVSGKAVLDLEKMKKTHNDWLLVNRALGTHFRNKI